MLNDSLSTVPILRQGLIATLRMLELDVALVSHAHTYMYVHVLFMIDMCILC